MYGVDALGKGRLPQDYDLLIQKQSWMKSMMPIYILIALFFEIAHFSQLDSSVQQFPYLSHFQKRVKFDSRLIFVASPNTSTLTIWRVWP